MPVFTSRTPDPPPVVAATVGRVPWGAWDRSPRGVMVGILEPGEQLGDIVVPAGHCAIGFQTAEQVFVHVEPRDKLLELLDELRADLVGRKGWGVAS